MSILPMYKLCPRCGWSVPFNPDVGRLALICPGCKKPISPLSLPTNFPFPRKKF